MKPEFNCSSDLSNMKNLQSELAVIENKHVNKASIVNGNDQSRSTESGGNAWLENSPVCTKILDADFNLRYMSHSGVKALKIENIEEYYGKPYPPDFFPQEAKKETADLLKKVKEANAIITAETPVYDIDGKKLAFQSTFTRVNHENGDFNYIMAVSTEITQRKLAENLLTTTIEELNRTNEELKLAKEKAEESERLKSAFLANVSHEIRTPLNAILGFTELLNTSSDLNESEKKQFLELIQSGGERLLRIITDIVDISRIDTGQLTIHGEECNLNELIDKMNDEFSIQVQEKDIILVTQKSLPNDQSTINVDPIRLSQIFSNLLENALKFTEAGEIRFGYSLEDQTLHFCVKDQGCGIPPEDQSMVFERFRQLKNDYIQRGSGLGLAIVKELVELMGGKIWVESEINKGAAFYFDLPYQTAAQDEAGSISKNEGTQVKSWKRTILIAEDEKINYLYLKKVLNNYDCRILHANNGKEALDIIKNESVDLVLMDVRMPDMNGLEATKELRKISPSIPIIGQSAHVMPENIANALENGMNDYLEKPIKPTQIKTILEKYLVD